jgi:hypothetical protein
MTSSSFDTNRAADDFHIMLLRKAPVCNRVAMTRSLIKTTRRLSWQGICERYASESIEARLERFIFLLYNDRLLARRVVLARKGKSAE